MQKELVLAYAAGIIDGDGCFTITESKGNCSVKIAVEMTDKTVPHWFKENFEGHVYKRQAKNAREESFQWVLASIAAVCTTTQALLPYLKTKRLAALLVIDFCANFSGSSKEERARYVEYMQIANGKGPGSALRKEKFLQLLVS